MSPRSGIGSPSPHRHRGQILARAERAPCAGEEHGAHTGVRRCDVEGALQLLRHRQIERVEHVRPVEREPENRTDAFLHNER